MRTCPKCDQSFSDDAEFCTRDGAPLPAATTAAELVATPRLARRYRIIQRLGSGGMGTVFLAQQIAVGNRPVALKILQRKLLDDPEFLTRFQNEAASTGRIRHSNVVTIYESGQEDGTPYIAMEYLEGQNLREALRKRGPLPVSETVEIVQQIARGLHAAHKLGIIHRDLKPDNIFLTRDDEDRLLVKVVDFGIAKLRESATQTLTGAFLGTPAYMSFEQASGMRSDELDARSDIYSLGIVAYEMLAGRAPFHSDTSLGYVRKHLSEEPPPFRSVRPDLAAPPQVESVVRKALEKNRDQRYSSALEFARKFAEAAIAAPSEKVAVMAPGTAATQRETGATTSSRDASFPAAAGTEPEVAVQTPDITPASIIRPGEQTPTPESSQGPIVQPPPPSPVLVPQATLQANRRRGSEPFRSWTYGPSPKRGRVVVVLSFLAVVVAGGLLLLLGPLSHRESAPPAAVTATPGSATPASPVPAPPAGAARVPQTLTPEDERRIKDVIAKAKADAIAAENEAPGDQPKVTLEAKAPVRWDRSIKPGDKVESRFVDGGLKPESLGTSPEVARLASKGSTVTIRLDVDMDGSIRKGRRVAGDKAAAQPLVEWAKRNWRFSPPMVNGTPVKTSAVVTVQF